MKISYTLLKTFLDIDFSYEEMADLLTDIGLEVEGTTHFESIKGALKGIFVGEVLSCEPHPNADRLKLTQINIGEKTLLQIICGAPNIATGQKVPVATIGTMLYSEEGNFTIKKSKIRDVYSFGMVCSEKELGLGDANNGIMVLDENLPIGKPLQEIFKVEKDIIFEIGLTPNRSDAMSHFGVARDLRAALLYRNSDKKAQDFKKPCVENFTSQTKNKIEIVLEKPDLVRRYAGVLIENITIKPAPLWIQNKLKALGLKPINNIVDITNYVLHELGQPLHAFDLEKIKKQKIIVKTFEKSKKITTLDGKIHNLKNEDLMICDGVENPLCIAGVFGGMDSGVSEKTQNIFLESAYFDAISIRKTAKKQGLHTDASFRFERGVDVEMVVYALKRAALLIQENAGGNIGEIVDIYQKSMKPFSVTLSYGQIKKLVGEEIPKKDVRNILEYLEIKIISETKEKMILEVPSYRTDVQRPADVIEEILRIYGYNNISFAKHFKMPILKENNAQKKYKSSEKISNYLIGQGFFQIMNNSLTKPAFIKETNVSILNPLSSDLSVMRSSLLFGGLETIAYNINRKNKNLLFFEWGHVYFKNEKYLQQKKLGLWLSGNKIENSWKNSTQAFDFYDLKNQVFSVIKQCSYAKIKIQPTQQENYKQAFLIFADEKKVGTFGEINKDVLQNFQINQNVFYADLDGQMLLENTQNKHKIRLKDLPKYPQVYRDFALLIDEKITFEQLLELALQTEKKILKGVNLFDVYQGEKLPKGKKSYALRFVLQDENKTLSEKQIEKTMAKLQKAFEATFQASLR